MASCSSTFFLKYSQENSIISSGAALITDLEYSRIIVAIFYSNDGMVEVDDDKEKENEKDKGNEVR